MNRRGIVLVSVLVAVVLSVGFYFLLWKPKAEEIATIDAERETVMAAQAQLEQELAQLEEVRAQAPDIQSEIVAAESIVPRDVALPSALRQLQAAADEAGVELPAVTFGRPAAVGEATPGLAAVTVTVQMTGGYYEIVDFLRRMEDPAISPRGVTWTTIAVTPGEYPELSVNLNGSMYSVLPTPPAPPAAETPAPAEGEETTTTEEVGA